MSAADRILERRQGKSFEQAEAERASDNMFWWMTFVNAFLYVAIAAWKFFFFSSMVISDYRWALFLQLTAVGAPEAFRMASLIMAYFEAKQKRIVTVWFGIIVSIIIILYDIYSGRHLPAQAYESFVFLCLLSEVVGIRAIFGRAFEGAFVKSKPSIPGPQVEPEPAPVATLRTSKPQKKVIKRTKEPPSKATILVPRFSKPMTAGQIKAKIVQYQWKLNNNEGNPETNSNNISNLQEALKKLNHGTEH